MTIKPGEKIPSVTLGRLGDAGMEQVDTATYFKGKKIILVGVPGAFTPACSQKHLPGYIENADAIKAKGVAEILCTAVNDPFVMKAWSDSLGATGKVGMLPDGSAAFAKALGLTLDLTAKGLGIRSERYVMIISDGVVESLDVEAAAGDVSLSGASACMIKLK